MENNENTLILGIESSCDETAAAVVKNGRTVLSNVIYSQIAIHKPFGGVVPEIASRSHVDKISQVVESALQEANVSLCQLSAIGVTYGPGLVGALLVGLSFAKGLAYAAKLPLVGVHHIEGHICANYLEHSNLKPPYISLVVSGGHTHLVYVKDFGVYEILGKTRDDAAGEAFDKVARSLGLSYPGGVEIDRLAKMGNPKAFMFPRIWLEQNSLDFSFSGLKSAVLNLLNQKKDLSVADVAASFQQALVDVLVKKAMDACKLKQCHTLTLSGGVCCNSYLRKSMTEACQQEQVQLRMPSPIFCTDNAAMIASCAFFDYERGNFAPLSQNAYPNLVLGQGFTV